MCRGVPLMADLRRAGTHPLLAFGQPAVRGIAHIIQEHRQRTLIRPDRRMRPPARAAPRLHLLRRPRPRPRHRERLEPPDQPLPALHQRPAQPAAALLAAPALQHRLEQRRLRPQRCVTPSTSTSAADPPILRACDNRHLHTTSTRCNETGTQRNRIRCLILAPTATPATQDQVRPRGVQPPHHPRPQPAVLEGQVRGVHANRRMMHRMQLRSF